MNALNTIFSSLLRFGQKEFHSNQISRFFHYGLLRMATLDHMAVAGPFRKHRRPNWNMSGSPFLKGIVLKTLVKKPKKPNSANRKCVTVRLSNGKEVTAYIPGEGHNLQDHSIVLVRGGRCQDLIGVKHKVVRGKYDCAPVQKKNPNLPIAGSKISLISNAGIRYEGLLYTINTEDATVALARVRSFGTEDRNSDKQVPPRDEIYDYIIFRGSDISDIHVCETSEQSVLNQDPAIVTVSQSSNSLNLEPTNRGNLGPSASALSSNTNANFPHHTGNVNHAGHVNLFHTSPPSKELDTINLNLAPAQHLLTSPMQPAGGNFPMQQQQPSAPTLWNERSGGPPLPPGQSAPIRLLSPMQNEESVNHINSAAATHRTGGSASLPSNQLQAVSYGGRGRGRGQNDRNRNHDRDESNYDSSYYHNQRMRYEREYDARYRNQNNGYRTQGSKRGGGGYNDYNRDRKSNLRHPNVGQKTEPPAGQKNKHLSVHQGKGGGTRQTFKDDYDFESANAKIADELTKISIGGANKENENDDKSVSVAESNENSESIQLADVAPTNFYDKEKSFFDTISSEVLDRSNGVRKPQMNRREERRVNSETFGSATVTTVNRGGYRGSNYRRGMGSRRQGGWSGGAGHRNRQY